MAFYRNGKLVYDFQKDGKFYKKTKTREGEQSLCQMVQCKCGGWASIKLVNTPTHMANKQHTEWAKKHGQKVVQRYKKKEKEHSTTDKQQHGATPIDISTLFFNDRHYCSIREFTFDDDIIYSWTPTDKGVWIAFNGDLDFLVKRFYLIADDDEEDGFPIGEDVCGADDALCIHSNKIQTRGLIDILNFYGEFPKSPQECLYQLIQYHLFREFCLRSYNADTKTFDERIIDAVETSGCTDDEPWKQIHQTIDDELQKSGITSSSSLEELYHFLQQQASLPDTQRQCVLTLLKREFTTNHVIDAEILFDILTVPWE